MATLEELAQGYEYSAGLLRDRLSLLRRELKQAKNPKVIFDLKRRIADLTPMLTQMNELAEHCRRYYERGYRPNPKFAGYPETIKRPKRFVKETESGDSSEVHVILNTDGEPEA